MLNRSPAVIQWPKTVVSLSTGSSQTPDMLLVSIPRRPTSLRVYERSRTKLLDLLASRCPRRRREEGRGQLPMACETETA
eukprot:757023-Hanusia_phi.AAC.3